jgi:hypothetical protein
MGRLQILIGFVVLLLYSGRALSAPLCGQAAPSQVGNVCYRDAEAFKREHFPSRKNRVEAQRWLQFDPVCETYLSGQISEFDQQIHALAGAPAPAGGTPNPAKVASQDLDQCQQLLAEARIDQHTAYDVIQDELREELAYSTWRNQILLGATFLGGAGDARDIGLDLHWDTRAATSPGFRYSLFVGLHRVRSVYQGTASPPSTLNDLPPGRDPTLRLSVPVMGGLSWAWIQSSIFISGGASWTSSNQGWAIVGQVGVGFLQSWLRNRPGKGAGPVTEARFVVQPFIPIGPGGPVSVMFGIELGAGVGFTHAWCDPDDPTDNDCRGLTPR